MITVKYTPAALSLPNYLHWSHESKRSLVDSLNNFIDVENVEMLTADGKELETILAQFTNIPRYSQNLISNEVVWFGDVAKFIAANLL